MSERTVGISDIQIYLPAQKMELDKLVEQRVREVPRLERHLARAMRATGQRAIRFPTEWEDPATMAASSAYKLITENQDLDPAGIRYLTIGTESGLDHSKPVSSFVEGMLQQAGVKLPESLSSFQVQHACAGGTLSLLSVAALLKASGRDNESGIVMCSDVARYQTHTTAEVTQGAGSVSMLVENNPKLIEIDLTSQGYCSRDVDDFFRPLGSKTAKVKGTYSMQQYRETLESAFEDHCRQVGRTPEEVLESTDLFVLHTPFRNLPETGMMGLIETHLGLEGDEAKQFLADRGLYDAIDVVGDVGNIYTGAMYLTLAFQLYHQHRRLGEDIVGKRILFASYGSGNIMTVISGTIAESAPRVIERWDMESLLADTHQASMAEYEQWVAGPYVPAGPDAEPEASQSGTPLFTLRTVRDDGYHEYSFNVEAERRAAGRMVPVAVSRTA